MRRIPSLAILTAILLAPAAVCAYPPLLVLRAGADLTAADSLTRVESRFLAGADIDWRTAAGENAYVWLWSSADAVLSPADGYSVADRLEVAFTAGRIPNPVDFRATASLTAVTGLFDAPARLEPSWNATVLFPLRGDAFALGADISGSARWTADDATDRIENRVALRATLEPTFARACMLEAGGSLDFYPGSFILDGSGFPTEQQRTDVVVSGSVEVDALAGYFTRWSASTGAGARFSDANRFVDGSVEAGTEDRLFATAGGALALSPTRRLSLDFSMNADGARYLSRATLDPNGSPTDAPVFYLRATAGARIDWSPLEGLFLVGRLSAAGALSNDAEFDGWSTSVALEVQLRL